METLIPVHQNQDQITVSARDLHTFLDVTTDFTTWCKRMFDYGFEEGEDFSLLKIGEGSAHNKTDYQLTLDCAKEIAMIQRNDKGKQARKYFIEIEKEYRNPLRRSVERLSRLDIARMLLESEEERLREQQLRKQVEEENKALKPKAVLMDRVMDNGKLMDIWQAAKYLQIEDENGQIIDGRGLIQRLRQAGILFVNRIEPKQKYVERGYFEYRLKWKTKTQRFDSLVSETFVTEKGISYLAKKFGTAYTQNKLTK